MGIRFDTATGTYRDKVGTGGTITNNAVRGKIVGKGDGHTVSGNTITEALSVVYQFGLQYEMNQNSKFNKNAASELTPRGKKCKTWKNVFNGNTNGVTEAQLTKTVAQGGLGL